ncbi:hypothetical protein KIN20_010916 [Parelaphostrongylus tenuis]|uniref:Uncharacterized protein n=1 Tax=Parelaphostrongylus tenuis TaxID=148309 RepID=A0AAD5MC38_PARTN|nr:hypothetical protein KIN20_010916 [Parelaphostrongylus tenuis]
MINVCWKHEKHIPLPTASFSAGGRLAWLRGEAAGACSKMIDIHARPSYLSYPLLDDWVMFQDDGMRCWLHGLV